MKTLLILSLAVFANVTAFAKTTSTAPDAGSTHRQAAVLKPKHGNDSLTLHTFVVDRDGNIVAAVSPNSGNRSRSATSEGGGWLQVFGPERALLREIAVPFPPTALALSREGDYLVAGSGNLARLSTDGKVIEQTHVTKLLGTDTAKLKEMVLADYKASRKDDAASNARNRQAYENMIKALDEKAQPTARDKARLASLKQTLQYFDRETKEPSESQIASMIQQRLRIPGISVSDKGLVLTLAKNRGYEVWNTGPHFENPRRVLGDLRGCCGQMDVIAAGKHIIAAENTKFQVGIYDLEGKSVTRFGERFKDGNNGFGSCCNPMNVICCENGELVTAESSIGHIKRFSADGKYLGTVGRARIGGGCKHVALGFDAKRDRYYVQYEDLNHICVLLPNAEAAPFVADEDGKQKQAEAAFVKLAGKWKRQDGQGAKKNSRDDSDYVSEEEDLTAMEIRDDHSLKVTLADKQLRAEDDGFRRWVVTGFEEGALRVEVERADGYVDFVARITPKGDTLEFETGHTKHVFKRQ